MMSEEMEKELSENIFTFNAIRAYDQAGERAIIFIDPPGDDNSYKYKLRLLYSQGVKTFWLQEDEVDGLIELLTIARNAKRNG